MIQNDLKPVTLNKRRNSSRIFIIKAGSDSTPIYKVKVRPNGHSHIMLGEFSENAKLKGFSIELRPNPNPHDSVDTQITQSGSEQNYKLFMHVVNHGNKTVTAVARQLP